MSETRLAMKDISLLSALRIALILAAVFISGGIYPPGIVGRMYQQFCDATIAISR